MAGALVTAASVFYAPGDWLADSLTVRQRRATTAWLLIVWIIPGLPLWLALRNALWFIGFMSIFAIWLGCLSAVAAETPVESQKADS